MSDRNMIVGPGREPERTPTTPVSRFPIVDRKPEPAQRIGDDGGCALFYERELGCAWRSRRIAIVSASNSGETTLVVIADIRFRLAAPKCSSSGLCAQDGFDPKEGTSRLWKPGAKERSVFAPSLGDVLRTARR
jgi:hypothetical protein